MADRLLNPDGISEELSRSLVWALYASSNGVIGTVAGTVIDTLLYNSCEAVVVRTWSTDEFDRDACGSSEYACGFDHLIVVETTMFRVETVEAHVIGVGLTCVCVAPVLSGVEAATIVSFH